MYGSEPRTDSYTRVSYKRNAGYFERVGGSCCGAFVGVLLLMGGFPVLFLNEVRHLVVVIVVILFQFNFTIASIETNPNQITSKVNY